MKEYVFMGIAVVVLFGWVALQAWVIIHAPLDQSVDLMMLMPD